ncbi:helix-turn-helix transcriptional regulator [Nonomuraea sp. SMC257]|uniref:Helix-turn-helix transcriptional regulator n=2 Tax=Nonomuraea montanisoli TaxID=2741721 RepID=A0A7Y6M8T7_9ACTN|nr:helix-turn-helix transcriptional regulator [Nonomuraea montanisoli]
MQEPTFLILTALAAEAQHGYGIMADVLRMSGERVRLRAGTLYAALDRLEGEGLVEADREEVVDGRARRYYRLTSHGEARLVAEAERMRGNADAAAARLRARLRPALAAALGAAVLLAPGASRPVSAGRAG